MKRWLNGACVAAGLLAGLAEAGPITLVGIMSGRAMLQVDGTTRTYGPGQAVGASYRLVEVGSDHVVVESQGRRQRIQIGQRTAGLASGEESAVLAATPDGHYVSSGTINEKPVRFLVDTGATSVSMGRSDAQRLGLNKLPGKRRMASTANGQIATTCVQLDSVTLGDISMSGVEGCYSDGEMPVVLLGMTFLSRTEMKFVGTQLQLRKRY